MSHVRPIVAMTLAGVLPLGANAQEPAADDGRIGEVVVTGTRKEGLLPTETLFLGVRHSLTSPFGFNGAFWYLRANANF